MKNSKLIVYLKSLKKSEIRELEQFILFRSPKVMNEVNTLFKYLKSLYPKFPDTKISKEYICNNVFKKEEKGNKKVLNAMYKLGVLIDEYLIFDILRDTDKDSDFLLLKALKKRKLDKFFFKKVEQMQDSWQSKPQEGIEHLYDEYRLNEMCFSHPNYSLVKEMPINPELLIDNIDKHYFTVKLYWSLCICNNNSYLNKADVKGSKNINYFINEIIELCKNNSGENTKQAILFHQMLVAFMEKDYTNITFFKNDFYKNADLYKIKERYDIMTFISRACYENYKIGIPNSLSELLEINNYIVENNLVLDDGYIGNEKFWNIVYIGLAGNKLNWTEAFIQNYGKYLQDEYRKDTVTICTSLLAFYRSEYKNALQILATVKFQNPLHGVYAKSIQLKCFYELDGNYDDLFLNLTKSFNLYINRKEEFSVSTKKMFLNFISISRKLQIAKNDPDRNLTLLAKRVNNTNNLAYKSWISEKLNQLLEE